MEKITTEKRGKGRPVGTTKPGALVAIGTRVDPAVLQWLKSKANYEGITVSIYLRKQLTLEYRKDHP